MVDRIVVKDDVETRLTDSLETALKLSGGKILVDIISRKSCFSALTLLVQFVVLVLKSWHHGCSHSTVRLELVQSAMDLA